MTSEELKKIGVDTVSILEAMLLETRRAEHADAASSALVVGIASFLRAHLEQSDIALLFQCHEVVRNLAWKHTYEPGDGGACAKCGDARGSSVHD